jgi:HPt (histidine-containing phosphotransfer) domain-containing protein
MAALILTLGLDTDTMMKVHSLAEERGMTITHQWSPTEPPAICIAADAFRQTLFDIYRSAPDCILCLTGLGPVHTSPPTSLRLQLPARVAALETLLDMILTPMLEDQEMEEIRAFFWERFANDQLHIASWLQQRQWSEFQRIGHQIAGSAATLGFPTVGHAGRGVELAARNENYQGLILALEKLLLVAKPFQNSTSTGAPIQSETFQVETSSTKK